jgi:transcriptional regulator with AAA-type ATPase domain
LLIGEPGCGFELCARHLHLPNTPWIVPEETEWLASNPFEPLNEARDGTLFLPDIAGLSKAEQKGLLQLLGKLEKFNVRLICARRRRCPRWPRMGASSRRSTTSSAGLTIRVPALSDHAEDIPDIAGDAADTS